MDLDERPSGRDVLAALLPYAMSEVAALFRAGDVKTLTAIAMAQPAGSFNGRKDRARWVAEFLSGDIDVWAAAGAWLFWRTTAGRAGNVGN